LLSASTLVVASMIGAGVFTTSGFALADLGSSWRVLAVWLVGGVVALCGAICYGSLARFLVESGGEYLYLSRTIHPLAGFAAGWVSLLAGFTGALAFAATAFESYALPTGQRPAWLPTNALAVGAILLCAALHSLRARPGVWLQDWMVIIKLVLLAAFLVFALGKLLTTGWEGLQIESTPPPFSAVAFATSLMWVSLSYSGFNAAVYVAGEVREPRRTVPRAMFLGTLVVMLFYLALNAVFVLAPRPELIRGQADVAAITALTLGGPWLAAACRGVISLALLTSVSALVMSGPRVYAKMAEDGLFPRWFRFQGEVPRWAVLFQAGLAVVVVCLSELRELLSYLGFTLSVCAALTVASLFLVRRRLGASAVAIPGYPVVPAFFVLATLLFAALAVARAPWECAIGTATLAVGAVIYAFIPRSNREGSPMADDPPVDQNGRASWGKSEETTIRRSKPS
jgi:APA family basic amino acid/polyamine antiporter